MLLPQTFPALSATRIWFSLPNYLFSGLSFSSVTHLHLATNPLAFVKAFFCGEQCHFGFHLKRIKDPIMQINFKSFIANLLGERLLHKACDRLKTRVLWLWNASWRDTRLYLLSRGWQLSGRFRAVQGSDLEELCLAASPRQGEPCSPGKESGLTHDSGAERDGGRKRDGLGGDQEPPEPPDMWRWPLWFGCETRRLSICPVLLRI